MPHIGAPPAMADGGVAMEEPEHAATPTGKSRSRPNRRNAIESVVRSARTWTGAPRPACQQRATPGFDSTHHGRANGNGNQSTCFKNLVARVTGLEPATFGVTGRRSNQLSYTRIWAGARSMQASV
jgi:hypothetical protein